MMPLFSALVPTMKSFSIIKPISLDGVTVPEGHFIQPRIEAEIAFVMKAPLAGDGITCEDVIAATDFVAPALEILNK